MPEWKRDNPMNILACISIYILVMVALISEYCETKTECKMLDRLAYILGYKSELMEANTQVEVEELMVVRISARLVERILAPISVLVRNLKA